MARPVDSWNNNLYWDFAPRYVSFSGWVGDQDPDFGGLTDAMNNMMQSAWAKYVSFGSDTGGYRQNVTNNGPQGRTQELFLRWAQLNSLMGFFENGGENEHRPWMFEPPQLTTDIYRYFVNLHMSLSTYLLSAGSDAFEKGHSIITPIASKPFLPWDSPSTYAYFLGPSVFVDPVLKHNASVQNVHFPSGNNYVDWRNNSLIFQGGSTVLYPVPLDGSFAYPVFHLQGHLLVRNMRPVTIPLAASEDEPINVLLPCPRPSMSHSITVRRWRMTSQDISYVFVNGTHLEFKLSAHPRRVSLTLSGVHVTEASNLVSGATLAVVPSKESGGVFHIPDISCKQSGAHVVLRLG